MNIKRIMSFIATAIFSSGVVFANVNDEKLIEKTSFDAVNNESKESNLGTTKEINRKLEIPYEKKDIKTKFLYLNLQSYVISPEIGLGFRHKIDTYGYDLNFSYDPIISIGLGANIGTVNANLLKYFNTKNHSNYYIGLGATNFFALNTEGYFPLFYSPNLCIGRQFDKSFVQLKALFPQVFTSVSLKIRLTPIPSLSVGFAF